MKKLLISIAVCVWSSAGVVAFWVFEPAPRFAEVVRADLVNSLNEPTTVFRPGETIYIVRTMNGHREVIYNQAWRLLLLMRNNLLVAREEILPLPIPVGVSTRTVTFRVPVDAPEGQYKIQTFVNYKLNPLRDELIEFDHHFIEVKK